MAKSKGELFDAWTPGKAVPEQELASILNKCCFTNNIAGIKKCLEFGAKINNPAINSSDTGDLIYPHAYNSPFLYALRSLDGDYSTLDYLISQGADVQGFDNFALRFSARMQGLEEVKYLIKNGAILEPIGEFKFKLPIPKRHRLNSNKESVNNDEKYLCIDGSEFSWRSGIQSIINMGVMWPREYSLDNALLHAAAINQVDVVKFFIENCNANIDAAYHFGERDVRSYIEVLREKQKLEKQIEPSGLDKAANARAENKI